MKYLTVFSSIILALIFLLVTPSNVLAVVQTINGDNSQGQTIQGSGNIQVTNSGNTHTIGVTGTLPVANGGTGSSSFTLGSIFFFNGTGFAEDNSNFFWDDTNNRLGLGTSSPSTTLSVNGTATVTGDINLVGAGNRLYVGIGTTHGYVQGANNHNSSGVPGVDISLKGGAGGLGANGGFVALEGGDAGHAGGSGGSIYLIPSDSYEGNGSGGNLEFKTGKKTGSGNNGQFKFWNPTADYSSIFDFSQIGSSDKTFTFPNSSGTFGLLESGQIWTGLNKYEASSNSTIYVGSSIKSGCIALGDSDGSGMTYITANDGVLSATSSKPGICQ